MTIRVLSFDVDGCLFNANDYLPSILTNNDLLASTIDNHPENLPSLIEFQKKRVIEANQVFLDDIKKQNDEFRYSQVISFIGSNRQSMELDYTIAVRGLGSKKYFFGSCVNALDSVSDYLGARLDPLMLADIANDQQNGQSYYQIKDVFTNGTYWELIHAPATIDKMFYKNPWTRSETKVPLLFAQINKIAFENPKEEIIFDFYDDRLDLLMQLENYYTQFDNLLPENVTFRVNRYKGDKVEIISSIQGTGPIRSNYPALVKQMNHEGILEFANTLQTQVAANEENDVVDLPTLVSN